MVGCIPIGDSFVLRNDFSDLKPSDVPKTFPLLTNFAEH